MEPDQQVEIQLGHACNNRCVFCVSGQRTALGMARPVPAADLVAEIRAAHSQGHRKLTLLGGEPTLHPGFLDLVREAVALGFEEIVIFSNGVRTAREEFVERILATGGRFQWRFSFQGATQDHHERTTLRPGSFDRLVRSLEIVAARGQKITVNMCVVQSNFESVDRFPELLLPFGVSQLHLDMVRPLDAGQRTSQELRAMIPRYSDLAAPLARMVAGFPAGFDVNIGNLPYCIAPELAPWIHHDGETTFTIAVDGEGLSHPWDKYEVKRRDKVKPESCRQCLFDDRCGGVFETYRDFYGFDELVPVTPERLREVDPGLGLFSLHLRPVLDALAGWAPPAPFRSWSAVEASREEVVLTLEGAERLRVALRPPGAGVASTDLFSVWPLEVPPERAAALQALRSLWTRLVGNGRDVLHPLGDDALGSLAPTLAARLDRLRRGAPFHPLTWTDVIVSDEGRRAELLFEGPAGERAVVWLAEVAGRPRGGYRLENDGKPTEALVMGLGALMASLGAPAATRSRECSDASLRLNPEPKVTP